MDEAGARLSEMLKEEDKVKTIVRRLYDIANVLLAAGVTRKVIVKATKKTAFQWVGLEGLKKFMEELQEEEMDSEIPPFVTKKEEKGQGEPRRERKGLQEEDKREKQNETRSESRSSSSSSSTKSNLSVCLEKKENIEKPAIAPQTKRKDKEDANDQKEMKLQRARESIDQNSANDSIGFVSDCSAFTKRQGAFENDQHLFQNGERCGIEKLNGMFCWFLQRNLAILRFNEEEAERQRTFDPKTGMRIAWTSKRRHIF